MIFFRNIDPNGHILEVPVTYKIYAKANLASILVETVTIVKKK